MGLAPQKVLLALFDMGTLLATAALAFFLRGLTGDLDMALYTNALPILILAPFLGITMNLYQSIPLPPHREIKNIFLTIGLIYCIILALMFFSKSSDAYSRLVILGSWICSLFTVPIMRALARRLFSRMPWWGTPLVIFDDTPFGRSLWHWLKKHPSRGLMPVDIVSLPHDAEELRTILRKTSTQYPTALALLMGNPATQYGGVDIITEITSHFRGLLIVPSFLDGRRRHWLTPRDLGNSVGLLVRQNLRDRRRQVAKRLSDIVIALLASILILPLCLIFSLLIVINSPGSPFYRQKRIGQGGKTIHVIKFRTMVPNADAVLQSYLDNNPELRKEWEKDQKLKKDPRVTYVGAFLRKTSLDELPQLINVYRGDMSLVGPRPIVENEIAKYGSVYDDYCRVRPGITGLWQISGRNNTTYAERVDYDHYYVNNWSLWLDIWILCRTIPVVLTGYGAY